MASVNYTTIGAVILIFVLAALVVSVARAIIHRLLGGVDVVSADNRAAVQARAKQLGRALTLLAYGIAALASVSLALSRVGIVEPTWNLRELGRWLTTHGINVVVIVAGAWVVVRAANLAIEHLQFKLGGHHVHTDLEWRRRAVDRRVAHPDGRRHCGAGDRVRRPAPGARRDCRLLPDPRRSGANRRSGADQRRDCRSIRRKSPTSCASG